MTLYLDTETTGLSAAGGHTIVEVAIVDEHGAVLIDTLVDPQRSIPYGASDIHGITDEMVRGQPTLVQLLPKIADIVGRQQVVIYNAAFDRQFFPDRLRAAAGVSCAMTGFADRLGGRWRKLDEAARHVGHRWTGVAHRALSDALACRAVWRWLQGS